MDGFKEIPGWPGYSINGNGEVKGRLGPLQKRSSGRGDFFSLRKNGRNFNIYVEDILAAMENGEIPASKGKVHSDGPQISLSLAERKSSMKEMLLSALQSDRKKTKDYWRIFLDEVDPEIKEFCEKGIDSTSLFQCLRKIGFRGHFGFLTDWLDAKGYRKKKRFKKRVESA